MRGWQQHGQQQEAYDRAVQWPLAAAEAPNRGRANHESSVGVVGGVGELPQAQPWVSGRVVASAASLAGFAGGRRWRASLAGVAGGRRWRASQAKPHKNRGDFN